MRSRARVTTVNAGEQSHSFPIPAEGTMIGRESDNFIQLVEPPVSKHHAEIRPSENGWCIRDLGSRNGTFVNGKRVEQAVLGNGDRIIVGSVQLVFETIAEHDEWRPFHEIDFSSEAGQQTISQVAPPPPGGDG